LLDKDFRDKDFRDQPLIFPKEGMEEVVLAARPQDLPAEQDDQ
jgi:hypothetical protein